jgi:hypothetical protein
MCVSSAHMVDMRPNVTTFNRSNLRKEIVKGLRTHVLGEIRNSKSFAHKHRWSTGDSLVTSRTLMDIAVCRIGVPVVSNRATTAAAVALATGPIIRPEISASIGVVALVTPRVSRLNDAVLIVS